ncbi:hypothetical protein BB558_005584 [Smittium angustum]|uniref:Splicing factor Cactin n=1 Tax=Smittium angustum TaxID=133377 RepID=A0A2U1J027_SMIAN|nr:hypothetical protein BB558_005584 [Smittium angustum]
MERNYTKSKSSKHYSHHTENQSDSEHDTRPKRNKDHSDSNSEFNKNLDSGDKSRDSRDSVYTDLTNPFNDNQFDKKFVWKKKEKIEKKMGMSKRDIERKKMELREETKLELEKLQERRKQREIEMEFREKEKIRLQQEAEQEQLGDWKERENQFHLKQAKKRAEIRSSQGRAKPIDILAVNLKIATQDQPNDNEENLFNFNINISEPWRIVQGLDANDTNQLYKDIQMYIALEKNEQNLEFWKSMLLVCDAQKQRYIELASSTGVTRSEKSLLISIIGKKKSQHDEAIKHQEELARILSKSKKSESNVQSKYHSNTQAEEEKSHHKEKHLVAEEFTSDMEPKLLEYLGREDRNLLLYSPEDDLEILREQRKKVLQFELVTKRFEPEEKEEKKVEEFSNEMFSFELEKGDDFEEELFLTEAQLETNNRKKYVWEDKYKPRKPKYFNKVHTGFEWNKYNQTHYDFDNPPPKVVRGYKFNIFYPDLIDKSSAPTYKIEPDPEAASSADSTTGSSGLGTRYSGDTVIIRFMAGPPYEDVAFKIVNREWEYSRKHGFRNSFDRNVLQLHFKFRKHFYKR